MLGMKPRKSYKKFALIGTSSVGKTTLISKLEKKLSKKIGEGKVSISQEAARYYFSRKRVKKPFSYLNQKNVQSIARRFENKLQMRGYKIIICDRSVIDAVAYVHAMGDEKGAAKLHARMKEWVLTYDHFFLLDPEGVTYQTDKVRREDEETRNNFHLSFVRILKENNLPHSLISGDKKQRVNKMFKIISASMK